MESMEPSLVIGPLVGKVPFCVKRALRRGGYGGYGPKASKGTFPTEDPSYWHSLLEEDTIRHRNAHANQDNSGDFTVMLW